MKLKYYLRGLGIGVIVTAVIMSITNKPQEMTDAQIKIRALELGMVEESVLADLQAKEESNNAEKVENVLKEVDKEEDAQNADDLLIEEAVEEIPTTEVEETATEEELIDTETVVVESILEEPVEESVVEENEVKDSSVEEVMQEETASKENNNSNNEEEIINNEIVESFTIIKVEKGNGSEVVSRRLYEAGLVESAVEYNQFLVKNGYDRKLSVGNHEIPSGATYDDMARILCGMK